MEGIKCISQYRNRLDKSLADPELTNVETLKKLVRVQMLRSLECEPEESIENIIEKRTEEVHSCVQMLKSTSEYDYADPSRNTHRNGWKLKQDTEEYRVMYREGPEGTPFHSLLVEGYVDGPLDVCLCIAWESNLYRKWWPQSSIPTFKILATECLQKSRIGEQICLVRAKLSWPLSSREAIVHFFEFEYFQDDLIVLLFNSISDLESIDRSLDGFSKDAIPDKNDAIRIDVMGGMTMQKVSNTRSYFRTIANVDMKLDFVPPSFINFISRQLIGSGFMLYKKEVAALSRGDEDFSKALEDPLHCRIREALYSNNKQRSSQLKITEDFLSEDDVDVGQKTGNENEVEEVNMEESRELEETERKIGIHCLAINKKNREGDKSSSNCSKRLVSISPQVKHGLDTLEKAISLFQEHRNSNSHFPRSLSSSRKRAEESNPSEDGLNGGGSSEVSKDERLGRTSNEHRISFGSQSSRQVGSNLYIREANHSNNIVPTSQEENLVHQNEALHISLHDDCSFRKREAEASFIVDENKEVDHLQQASTSLANGSRIIMETRGKHKKLRKFCCLHINSERF